MLCVSRLSLLVCALQVLKLKCPGMMCPRDAAQHACTQVLSAKLTQDHTTPEIWEKYQRFVRLKSDAAWRTCPNKLCLHVQQRKVMGGDSMECERCHTAYCFRHDLAHAADPSSAGCAAYAKKLVHDSAESLEYISTATVKCPWPRCPAKIMKLSGCNHMTCTMCRTHFCYLCRGLYFGGLHFLPFNIFGCPGMQSDAGEAGCRAQTWRTVLRWTLGPPIFLLLIGLTLSLFTAIIAIWIVWLCVAWPGLLTLHIVLKRRTASLQSSLSSGLTQKERDAEHLRLSKWSERRSDLTWFGPLTVREIAGW
jgi:hypothetical protein